MLHNDIELELSLSSREANIKRQNDLFISSIIV